MLLNQAFQFMNIYLAFHLFNGNHIFIQIFIKSIVFI